MCVYNSVGNNLLPLLPRLVCVQFRVASLQFWQLPVVETVVAAFVAAAAAVVALA